MRELELKVKLSSADLARIEAAAGNGLSAAECTRSRLQSIYYVTPKHDLHGDGISLRVRRVDDGWVQTVKVAARLAMRSGQRTHHGARDTQNFGITLSANRRKLSREPWPNSRT